MKLTSGLAFAATTVLALVAPGILAADTFHSDLRGDGGDFDIFLHNSDDVDLLSYGNGATLRLETDNSSGIDVWMLGDDVTGTLSSRNSNGLRVAFGMCPEGMHNQALNTRNHASGLIIAKCGY